MQERRWNVLKYFILADSAPFYRFSAQSAQTLLNFSTFSGFLTKISAYSCWSLDPGKQHELQFDWLVHVIWGKLRGRGNRNKYLYNVPPGNTPPPLPTEFFILFCLCFFRNSIARSGSSFFLTIFFTIFRFEFHLKIVNFKTQVCKLLLKASIQPLFSDRLFCIAYFIIFC